MLKLEDIDLSVDYRELSFIESHLMHEVKRKGVKAFVKEYSDNIEDFRKDWSKVNFCFLLALLGYLDKSFRYDDSVKLDKYVLDARDFLFVELDEDLSEANKRLQVVLPSFYARGFIYSDVEEAV